MTTAPQGTAWVEARRATTRETIVRAAWELAARDGIGALSLRSLAAAVGMRAPSLYSHFPSKGAIYDAMFADGYDHLDRRTAEIPRTGELTEDLRRTMHAFLAFCVEDVPRYQLLFTHAVPGWEPSPDAYAVSQASYQRMADWFASHDITDPDLLDLFTALTSGFAAQQVANDPDGDRWFRLVDEAVALFIHALEVRRCR